MPRVVIISIVILATLVLFGYKAKQRKQATLMVILFTVAFIYSLIMLAGFFGIIGG